MHFDANTCKILKNPVIKFGVGESGDFLWIQATYCSTEALITDI